MKKIVLIITVFALSLNVFAKEVSVKKAMFFSLILPGMGQAYAQSYSKTGVFVAAELATYLSWMRLSKETDWAIDAYKEYAFSISGVPKDRDKIYYQLIQNNFSSELYNEGVIRYARNVFLIINNDQTGYEEYLGNFMIPEEYSWDWQNDDNWSKYKNLRYDKQNYEVYENFAVAALIVNRMVSMIDAAITAKRVNAGKDSSKFGQLNVAPDFAKDGMRISYEVKF